jgi:(R)-2-hydroxyacyl-CoA dehydratese activating ATPase
MISAGIDIGTRTAKAVILGPEGILASTVQPVNNTITRISRRVTKHCRKQAGLRRRAVKHIGATGYAGQRAKIAGRQFTTPLCAARALQHLDPDIRTIIDIGGLIIRVVQVDADGRILDYIENEKCASGSGRFLEMMAEALELPLTEIGPLSLSATSPLTLSSQCVVFAESEVVSHVNADENPADILAGLHRSIAERAASLARKMAFSPPVAIIGGVAKNSGVLTFLKQSLAVECRDPSIDPQLTGALGAALLARPD